MRLMRGKGCFMVPRLIFILGMLLVRTCRFFSPSLPPSLPPLTIKMLTHLHPFCLPPSLPSLPPHQAGSGSAPPFSATLTCPSALVWSTSPMMAPRYVSPSLPPSLPPSFKCEFNLPERFGLEYVADDGTKVCHRLLPSLPSCLSPSLISSVLTCVDKTLFE